MDTLTAPAFTSLGVALDQRTASFGELRPANELLRDPEALQARMIVDGYLYLHGYLDCNAVCDVRMEILRRLAAAGLLDEQHPLEEGVSKPGVPWGLEFNLASEPTDERWIGPNPVAHGPGGKKGKVC